MKYRRLEKTHNEFLIYTLHQVLLRRRNQVKWDTWTYRRRNSKDPKGGDHLAT